MARSPQEGSISPSASLRGTRETLSDPELESVGSDSEINGFTVERRTDKYGFLLKSEVDGGQEEELPVDVLRQREAKWLDMLSNWDKWMAKRHKKIKLRCQKGIPPSLRGRAWQYLSGSRVKMDQNPEKFNELDSMAGDPKWVDIIERDLHRQFPFHEMFVARGGHGQQDLYRVLKAYTLYRPDEGYCQAQAPVAAVLLMHMPAEQAFWCLVQICEKYLPGYYSEKLEAIQLDGRILFALLRKVSPVAHKHLSKQKIDPILYMTEWFMCAFSRTLPWSSVLRVWDMFFCEGVKIIFRVALILLKFTLGTSEKLKSCQGQYETMEKLRAIDPRCMQENFLIPEIVELQITERDVEREHLIQLKKWKEEFGELQYKSPSRMHGAKAISESDPIGHKPLAHSPSIILPSNVNTGKKTKEQKQEEKEQEKQRAKEMKEKEKMEKERKRVEKKKSKGKGDQSNGTVKEKNGSEGSRNHRQEPVQPLLAKDDQKANQDSLNVHQSSESLCSKESEDTYL
ncbi:TBC1 domain family member 10A [Hyperolius riggenbachi]|uniref:TBC1 domain family member 10A n=1 Tax=Hyperolius riggenbachi TaxID=752182 RepID=UPI0035A3CEB8